MPRTVVQRASKMRVQWYSRREAAGNIKKRYVLPLYMPSGRYAMPI